MPEKPVMMEMQSLAMDVPDALSTLDILESKLQVFLFDPTLTIEEMELEKLEKVVMMETTYRSMAVRRPARYILAGLVLEIILMFVQRSVVMDWIFTTMHEMMETTSMKMVVLLTAQSMLGSYEVVVEQEHVTTASRFCRMEMTMAGMVVMTVTLIHVMAVISTVG
jgi:hypothetical protein